MREILRLFFGALGLAMLLAGAAAADVTITREKAVVEHRTFNPAHRPKDMPPLEGDEAALTQSKFECQAGITYELLSHMPQGGRCVASIRVQKVQMTLQLRIVIWLPENAPQKLVAHEEGHRQIDQRVYDGAEKIARQIAAAVDGQTFRGEAGACDAAEKQATNTAAGQLCQKYIREVAVPAEQVGEAYDRITAHGTRAEPGVDEAIRQASAQEQKPTQPARSQGK